MATPSKRQMVDDETVVGHLHAVSPLKTSRQSRRYFEATLQTGREEFNRVVCFSSEKRNEFVHAADNGQAVKLVGTRKGISYSNPGGFDILVNSSSRLDVAGELDFPRRVPSVPGRSTIADVLALGPMQGVGVIEMKILQLMENKVVVVQGSQVELKRFQVCDATGQTELTVWDRLILSLDVGKSYKMQSLRTRKRGDRTVLTTTPSSVITTTGQVGQPASLQVMPVSNEETLRGPVTGVQIAARPRCPRCQAAQEKIIFKESTHRCERCLILQRTAAYPIFYSGLLIVVGGDGEERSMAFSNSSLTAFVRERLLSSHDGHALEEIIMAMPELEVTTNSEGLVACFKEVGGQEAKPSTSHAGETSLFDEESLTDYFGQD